MFYSLAPNVYLVNGAIKSCIYDLNNSKLYHINNLLAEKLQSITDGTTKCSDIDSEFIDVVGKMEKLELIVRVTTPHVNSISEICKDNTSCNFAWIEITNKCNLKCLHCYNDSEVHSSTLMSLENYKMVIDSLLAAKVKKIQLIGGEPFTAARMLKKMLDYTIGKFEFIEVFTNGTLLSNEWFTYLSDNSINVALSVYSYDPVIHDKITGTEGSHRKTNATIRKLSDYGIKYRVCNVLMKGVEIGKPQTALYTLNQDKDVIRMVGRAKFSLLTDELIKKKLITKETFRKPITRNFCSRMLSGHNCFNDKIYISADLKVFPCVMERRIYHCLIDNSKKLNLNEEIRKFNKDKIEECSVCEFRYACFDCRADSLSGDFYEKPWYCTYVPAQGEWIDTDAFINDLKNKWTKE